MAASSPRKRRSMFRTWRCETPRPARRRASASRSWAKARSAAKCASRRVLECRSMSDEKKTPKAEAKSAPAPKAGGEKKAEGKGKGKDVAAAPAKKRAPKPADYE